MENQNLLSRIVWVSRIMWVVDEQAEAVVTEEKGFIKISFAKEYRREFYDYILLMWQRFNQANIRPVAVTSFGKIKQIKIPCL